MTAAAQRDFLVRIGNITTGYFPRCTGGSPKSAVSESWDGGRPQPEKLTGPAILDNVEVSRDYDARRDEPVLRALRPLTGEWRTTLSVTPCDRDLNPIEAPRVYPHAILIELHEPEVDAGSGTPARWSLVFGVADVA